MNSDDLFSKRGLMDEIDNKILQLLAENSRMTYVDIGERVNLSRVAVRNRIKTMEENGIIERYSIIINPQKIGRTVSAFFDITVEARYFQQIANFLAGKDCITDIYQMTGSSHLHVHGVFSSDDELEVFLRKDLYSLKNIREINCDLILSRIKTRKGIRI